MAAKRTRDVLVMRAIAATVLSAACAQTSLDTDARRAIQASRPAYVAAMKRGDAAALARHFTEDAILLPQNSDMQRGRVAIERWFAGWLPTTTVQDFTITTEDVSTVGSTAYEVGTYRMSWVPQGAPPISEQGKYLMVWKRDAAKPRQRPYTSPEPNT